MSLRTRLPLGAGQAPWTREWGQGPCPEFLRSLGPTRAQRLAMEGARSAFSRWLHSLVQGLFKAESHLAKGLGFSRFPPKSWFVWGSGSWHKNAPPQPLTTSFGFPFSPPSPQMPQPWLCHRRMTVPMSWQTAVSHVGYYSEPGPRASVFKSSQASWTGSGPQSSLWVEAMGGSALKGAASEGWGAAPGY